MGGDGRHSSGLCSSRWLNTYALVVTMLQPLVRALLRWRGRRAREELPRLAERRGVPSLPRPPGALVWVHAVSFGEAVSVLRLVERIQQAHQVTILFTTTTVSGARLVGRYIVAARARGLIHQYLPADCPDWTRSFLNHWRPDTVIWVESDFWPQLMAEVHRRSIPAVLVNARLSKRSARMGRILRPLLGPGVAGFRLCLAADREQVNHFKALGADNVHYLGNLKAEPSPVLGCLRSEPAPLAETAPGPTWAAISTHPGEEEFILDAHQQLAECFPQLLTIIAPRNIKRAAELETLAKAANQPVQRKSQRVGPPHGGGIYIVDTMGELGEILPVCSAAFVGGSLTPCGGHNPYEPLYCGSVVLHGPHTDNFHDAYELLRTNTGSWEVDSAAELARALQTLFADTQLREAYRQCAKSAISGGESVTGAVFKVVDRILAEALATARS